MVNPAISVIIPTYKPGEYIWECLESLNRQSLPDKDFEVIIVLNGCNEPWHDKIREWYESHPSLSIRLIQTDTPGVSNARNIGIKMATGSYICFIDDDDYVSENYLSGLLNVAQDNPEAVVLSNSISFTDGQSGYNENYRNRKVYQRLSRGRAKISLLHARAIFNGPCMKLLKYSFMQGHEFDIHLKNKEDALFMFEISYQFKDILLAPEDCIYYRRFRQNSATTVPKTNKYIVYNQIYFIKKVCGAYLSKPLRYNPLFTVSRIIAAIKVLFIQLFQK